VTPLTSIKLTADAPLHNFQKVRMNYGTLTYECMYVEESIYYVLYILHYYLRNTGSLNCDNVQSCAADCVQLSYLCSMVSNELIKA